MTDWTAFIEARQADDDAAAESAPRELDNEQWPFRVTLDRQDQPDELAARRYVSQFRPARAKRQAVAVRVILAEHKHVPATFREDGFPADGFGCQTCARVEYGVAPEGWCATVRGLGGFWAGHPDYPGREAAAPVAELE